jgi:hypothetical protein
MPFRTTISFLVFVARSLVNYGFRTSAIRKERASLMACDRVKAAAEGDQFLLGSAHDA